MEIEKTRETSWKIQLKNKENIELTSVESSGEVRLIKLGLIKDENSIKVEMNKDEFFNFLSLISAFRDVVIGEVNIRNENETDYLQESSQVNNRIFQKSTAGISNNNLENSKNEELNPKEWDPW